MSLRKLLSIYLQYPKVHPNLRNNHPTNRHPRDSVKLASNYRVDGSTPNLC